MHYERDPEERDNPARNSTWDHAVESDCCENDQHDPGVSKCVDVKRVNQVVDVKNAPPDVENFQNKIEERDTAEHHIRQIVEECRDKESHSCSMLTHLFLGSSFDPALEGS